jgi:membrane protein implicated in regulation of membrane protease activity
MRPRLWPAALWLALLLAGPAAGQQPYSYVKFSLGVPWTLYFVFLALISIPFAVTIVLAWRRAPREEAEQEERLKQPTPAPTAGPDNSGGA